MGWWLLRLTVKISAILRLMIVIKRNKIIRFIFLYDKRLNFVNFTPNDCYYDTVIGFA